MFPRFCAESFCFFLLFPCFSTCLFLLERGHFMVRKDQQPLPRGQRTWSDRDSWSEIATYCAAKVWWNLHPAAVIGSDRPKSVSTWELISNLSEGSWEDEFPFRILLGHSWDMHGYVSSLEGECGACFGLVTSQGRSESRTRQVLVQGIS